MNTRLLITLFIVGSCSSLFAQDGHFSQFYNAPMFINASLTGLEQDQLRLTNNYRSQWNSISPYTTLQFGLDKGNDKWGYGLNWNKNSAGKGSIQTNMINLGIARHVNTSDNGYISLGFQGGLFQRSFDAINATFESQFNGSITDLLGSSGEEFSFEQVSMFDLNAGLSYTKRTDALDFQMGGSFNHIFSGNESAYEAGEQLLPRKLNIHASAGLHVDTSLTLTPMVLFQQQGTAEALNVSVIAKKRFQENKFVEFGLGTRVKDAFIFYGGVDLENIRCGISYDANTSILRTASRGFGAIELSLALKIGEAKKNEKSIPNPRREDRDEDGVDDLMDRCPDTPGDPKNLGCPGKLDSDGDGLTDDVDLCPFLYGLAVQSGCPDSDGDGIADIDDNCPTVYGAMNLMGCPDSDRDGISDKEDMCPTVFGLTQNNGCPDSRMIVNPGYVAPGNYIVTPNLNVPQNPNYIQIPANSRQNIQYQAYPDQSNGYIRTYPNSSETRDYSSALVLDNFFVLFAKDSWELTYEAKKQLRDYIIALGLNAEYKLLISGHTDTDGSPGYNIELGQKRASAVSAYLSEFGLKEGRIITISYGEHRPNSSNYTMESMARNRRVEVMLIR